MSAGRVIAVLAVLLLTVLAAGLSRSGSGFPRTFSDPISVREESARTGPVRLHRGGGFRGGK